MKLDQLLAVLHEDYPGVGPEETWDQMGMDSLEFIHFVSRIEALFSIEIPPYVNFETPSDLAVWLEQNA